MTKKKLVPKRRFEGLTGEWEEYEIVNIFNVLDGDRGSNYPGEADFKRTGNTLFLDTSNVKKNGFNFKNKKYITRERDQLLRSGKLEINDFVLTSRGTLGNVAFYDKKINKLYPSIRINSAMLILRPLTNLDFDSYYIETVLRGNVIKNFMVKSRVGSAQPHITKRDFSKINVLIPVELEEQQKIGDFFKRLDEMIELEQRKINKTKALKNAYLTEMYPAEGERVPKRRFEGFEDAWKVNKIVDLMNVTSVKRIHQSDWRNEGIHFIRARDIVAFFKNEKLDEKLYISKEKYNKYTRLSGKVEKGDLLVTGVGTIGIPMLIDNNKPIYFKDGNIIWFQNKNKIDGYYLYYYFNTNIVQNHIKNIAGIGTVGTYTIEGGKQTPIYLPSDKEQQKIGQFFKSLDDKITTQERKLEKLKAIKQAYLHEMFV